ncbi:hypothetical protein NOR_06443 [Metarhizium rileyi]|uniref:Uncharacterized protein n=1 Tax=Metarhizium rileyi (strain RCEF 4871) TaxID=1649241 RepID=A0A169YE74_METRR|nr:hypothetical protein NOR_06443 [Metarhizium rileyi RCEF 4871]
MSGNWAMLDESGGECDRILCLNLVAHLRIERHSPGPCKNAGPGEAVAAFRLQVVRDWRLKSTLSPMGNRSIDVNRDDFACLWGRRAPDSRPCLSSFEAPLHACSFEISGRVIAPVDYPLTLWNTYGRVFLAREIPPVVSAKSNPPIN